MKTELLRFDGAVVRDPAIDAWMKVFPEQEPPDAGLQARRYIAQGKRRIVHDAIPRDSS